MTRSPAPRLDARQVAAAIWGALVVLLGLYLALVHAHRPNPRYAGALSRDLAFGVGAALSVGAVIAARVLPRRLTLRAAAGRAELLALLRLLVEWGLYHGAALFQLAAFLVVRHPPMLALFAIDAAALVTSYPGVRRWADLAGAARAAAPAAR